MRTRVAVTAAMWCLVGGLTGCPGNRATPPARAPMTPSPTVTPRPALTPPALIYVVDVRRHCLVQKTVQIPEGTVEDRIRAIVKALSRAPANTDLARCVPPEASLRRVTVAEGTATLDFDQAFAKRSFWAGSDTEILRLYGLVNAVTHVEGVERVRLLVEGKPVESLGGHVETSGPLTRDDTLLKPQ